MTDLGPHAALPTTQLAATLTRLLNAHKPALPFLEDLCPPCGLDPCGDFNFVAV